MGYQITFENGRPVMSWKRDATIATDLALSCIIERGAWFVDKKFGLPKLPEKITVESLPSIRDRFIEATRWLVEAGRAKTITAEFDRDELEKNRIKIRLKALQANDQIVFFDKFVGVL